MSDGLQEGMYLIRQCGGSNAHYYIRGTGLNATPKLYYSRGTALATARRLNKYYPSKSKYYYEIVPVELVLGTPERIK